MSGNSRKRNNGEESLNRIGILMVVAAVVFQGDKSLSGCLGVKDVSSG